MTKDFDADVLICGAGAAGLTLAIDLARRGISFRLIDKAPGAFHGSRGKGIQPRTLEIFEDLGIVDRLFAMGAPYPPLRDHHPDGTHGDVAFIEAAAAISAEPYRAPLMLPQFLTEGVMRERLSELAARPPFGRELVGFESDADGVTAHLRGEAGEEQVRVRYLVGADGGRSFVRQALGIGFPGKTLGVRAVVADLMLTGLSGDAWHRFHDGDMERQIAICPLAGTTMFQLQAPIPLEGDVDLSAAGLDRLIADRSGRADIRVQSVSWASAYRMNARLADRYREGRIFLVGDAAHTHPPTGGQGLNTSVQDSYNLGWKLAVVLSGAPETLLDTYEEERRPIAASMLGLSTRLLDEQKRGDMRRGREVHQLDIGYPTSPLSRDMPGRGDRLTAGHRAPDATARGAGGQPLRLFDLFRGRHWTLLEFGFWSPLVEPRAGVRIHGIGAGGDVLDDRGQIRDAYRLEPGDWVLVRPDGYVGATGSHHHGHALEGYLEMVGLRADRQLRPGAAAGGR